MLSSQQFVCRDMQASSLRPYNPNSVHVVHDFANQPPSVSDIVNRSQLTIELLNKECSKEFLYSLSDKVDNWRTYAYALDLKEHQINRISTDSSLQKDARLMCMEMLGIWHKKFGFKATYLRLVEIFIHEGNALLAQTVCKLCAYHHRHNSSFKACLRNDLQLPRPPTHMPRSMPLCLEPPGQPSIGRPNCPKRPFGPPDCPKGLLARGAIQSRVDSSTGAAHVPTTLMINKGQLEPNCECGYCQPARGPPTTGHMMMPPQHYTPAVDSVSISTQSSLSHDNTVYSENGNACSVNSLSHNTSSIIQEVKFKGPLKMELQREDSDSSTTVVFTPVETAARNLSTGSQEGEEPLIESSGLIANDLESTKHMKLTKARAPQSTPHNHESNGSDSQNYANCKLTHSVRAQACVHNFVTESSEYQRATYSIQPQASVQTAVRGFYQDIQYDSVDCGDSRILESSSASYSTCTSEPTDLDSEWGSSSDYTQSYPNQDLTCSPNQCYASSMPPNILYETIPESTAMLSQTEKETLNSQNGKPPVPPFPLRMLMSISHRKFFHQNFSEKDQVGLLALSYKHQKNTICVFYSDKTSKSLASQITSELEALLANGSTTVKTVRMEKGLLKKAVKDSRHTHYVIVGHIPDLKTSKRVRHFFDPSRHYGHRILEIVFVCTTSDMASVPSGFLSLDCTKLEARELGVRILGHFAATPPVSMEIGHSWSTVPEIICIKLQTNSLGVKLETKKVSKSSLLPCITVIESIHDDCPSALSQKVPGSSQVHIQSINGCCLDGLATKLVTERLESEIRRQGSIQLMVRYRQESDQAASAKVSGDTSVDPVKEVLPIPVYILSDDLDTANHLFKNLTTDVKPTQMPKSKADDTLIAPSPQIKKQASAMKQFSPKSDEFVERKLISDTLTRAETSCLRPSTKPAASLPARNYILQLFFKDFSKLFAHVFFREAGLFVIAVSCSELLKDSLSQYEKILNWLRLIRKQTKFADLKRIIIVGVFDGGCESLRSVQARISLLNKVLEENDMYNLQLFDQDTNEAVGAENRSYVFLFDVSQLAQSCSQLYMCIEKCVKVFAERAKRFNSENFKVLFEAFDGLSVALNELSSMRAVTIKTDDVLMNSDLPDKPSHAFETLKAYSTALMDRSISDCLVKPQLLVNLMKKLGSPLMDYNYIYQLYNVNTESLKSLPVFHKPFIDLALEDLTRSDGESAITSSEVNSVCEWAEHLGLMFRFEYKEKTFFFVPSLAKSVDGNPAIYDWNEDRESHCRHNDATVVYAFLNFAASDVFFYKLLAAMLSEAVSIKDQKLHIKEGCQEAILPLCLENDNSTRADCPPVTVLTVYHPLQNVIEFRSRIPVSLNNQFRVAVMSKLRSIFNSSQFHESLCFDDAMVLHVPALDYDKSIMESALWKLKEFDEQNNGLATVKKQLLKTKLLTSEVLGEWVAVNVHKQIPSNMFNNWAKKLSVGDYWKSVGAKLQLLTTDEITELSANPNKGGNGAEVLTRWQTHSSLFLEDLLTVLRAQDVRLDALASEIESFYTVSDV